MPRYFFHITDGTVEHDDEGTDLPDNQSARAQAVIFAGETLQGTPEHIWAGEEMRVEVTNESGTFLYTVTVIGIDSPAVKKQ